MSINLKISHYKDEFSINNKFNKIKPINFDISQDELNKISIFELKQKIVNDFNQYREDCLTIYYDDKNEALLDSELLIDYATGNIINTNSSKRYTEILIPELKVSVCTNKVKIRIDYYQDDIESLELEVYSSITVYMIKYLINKKLNIKHEDQILSLKTISNIKDKFSINHLLNILPNDYEIVFNLSKIVKDNIKFGINMNFNIIKEIKKYEICKCKDIEVIYNSNKCCEKRLKKDKAKESKYMTRIKKQDNENINIKIKNSYSSTIPYKSEKKFTISGFINNMFTSRDGEVNISNSSKNLNSDNNSNTRKNTNTNYNSSNRDEYNNINLNQNIVQSMDIINHNKNCDLNTSNTINNTISKQKSKFESPPSSSDLTKLNVSDGLNLFYQCNNQSCTNYNIIISLQLNYGKFNLPILVNSLKCSICNDKKSIKFHTIGVINCYWVIKNMNSGTFVSEDFTSDDQLYIFPVINLKEYKFFEIKVDCKEIGRTPFKNNNVITTSIDRFNKTLNSKEEETKLLKRNTSQLTKLSKQSTTVTNLEIKNSNIKKITTNNNNNNPNNNNVKSSNLMKKKTTLNFDLENSLNKTSFNNALIDTSQLNNISNINVTLDKSDFFFPLERYNNELNNNNIIDENEEEYNDEYPLTLTDQDIEEYDMTERELKVDSMKISSINLIKNYPVNDIIYNTNTNTTNNNNTNTNTNNYDVNKLIKNSHISTKSDYIQYISIKETTNSLVINNNNINIDDNNNNKNIDDDDNNNNINNSKKCLIF